MKLIIYEVNLFKIYLKHFRFQILYLKINRFSNIMGKNKTIIALTKKESCRNLEEDQMQKADQNYDPPKRARSTSPKSRYHKATYTRTSSNGISPASLVLEVEGITIHSRGSSKGITYFECASHRQKNTPGCGFRARISGFSCSDTEGTIEIIHDHSPSCKFIPGNDTHDFQNNTSLNANKRIYKTMKLAIEKKLEEENWSTPGEILNWIKAEFSIDHHLSYAQVNEVVQTWREKNSVMKESYILQHSLNKTGLTFLRAYFTLNYRKNSVNKSVKIAIWSSDFQINRLRLTNHWFLDGTFTITPQSFHQLITIAIRDPNTGFVKPAAWILLGSKDEETYYQMFRTLKDIAGASGTLEWTLSSATLDFEVALINSFVRVFTDTRVIGCLFHFKQALYREAQNKGLTTDDLIEETQRVISSLGALSWKGNLDVIDKELRQIQDKYKETKHIVLVDYYSNNWLTRLKSGFIDYSSVDDNLRANSVLESYNCHVKNSLPRSPSWPKFLEFLISEEAKYVTDSFQLEQRGETSIQSVNFGQIYLPKAVKRIVAKKKKADKDEKELPINDSTANNPDKDKASKRKRTDNQFETENKKLKQTPATSSKDITEEQSKYTYQKPSKYITSDLANSVGSIQDPECIEWLRWTQNSCRYDCFLSVFGLILFPKYECFSEEQADRRHKYSGEYAKLCETVRLLYSAEGFKDKQKIVLDFWTHMHRVKFEDNAPGSTGYVENLIPLFKPLLVLQPYYQETRFCYVCDYEEKIRERWSLPIQDLEIGIKDVKSVQQYFDW